MIDIAGILTANILYVILITLGGTLVSFSVHFVPVGGAPAAMAQAPGIGTGTVQLAAGAGLTGLITAGTVLGLTNSIAIVLASGAVGAMLMIGSTMIVGQMVYVYGVGVTPAGGKSKYDPITKDRQDIYSSQGTEGHALPTASFISGIIGGGLGGLGGSLVYYSLVNVTNNVAMTDLAGLAGIFAIGIFFINAVIPSYNIGGTTEGFHDPKFKKWYRAVITSIIATIMCAIIGVIAIGGL